MSVPEKTAIAVRHVSKTFPSGEHALDDVTLDIREGEIFGLVGGNGAGKTTLLKILTGLLPCDHGNVTVLGHPTGSLGAKRQVAYLPEFPYLSGHFPARTLLGIFARLDAVGEGESRALLARVGLDAAAGKPLSRFSKGMLQRFNVAQTLLGNKRIVILDEPTSGLDPQAKRWMQSLILELHQQGKTILFASHQLGDVESLCQSVALLWNGKLLYHGTLEGLLVHDGKRVSLEEAYLQRMEGCA